MKKIYIDGQAGTTGLQIHERLKNRSDLEVLEIDEAHRKDPKARRALMEQADLVFLCLPDSAAKEAVALMEGLDTKIIDASTAHRTQDDWAYGFAELDDAHKEAIIHAKKTANPGCHASGVIALVYPLIKAGLLDPNSPICSFSLTGYTGGGKKMIADYEQNKSEEMESPKPYGLSGNHKHIPEIKKVCSSLTGYTGGGKKMIADYEQNKSEEMESPKPYGLSGNHKHIPEIKKVCSLNQAPLFVPVVADYDQGMLVTVELPRQALGEDMNVEKLTAFYADWYQSPLIQVKSGQEALYSNTMKGKDSMELIINGGENGYFLSARFDNLGKGASGAAVENMNLMLGLDPYAGLNL